MITLRTVSRRPRQTHQSSRWRSGQGLSEYALLLTLVAAVALGGLGLLGSSTAERVRGVSVSVGTGEESRPTVHVDGIDLSVQIVRPMVKVKSHVTVRDQNGEPVPGATVSGNWHVNGAPAGSSVDKTDSKGHAHLTYKMDADEVQEGDVVRLTITDVAASGYEYDSAGNVQSAAQIMVP